MLLDKNLRNIKCVFVYIDDILIFSNDEISYRIYSPIFLLMAGKEHVR